jgi:hypothetical protein
LNDGTIEKVFVNEHSPTYYDIEGYIKLMELLIQKFPKIKNPDLAAVKKLFNSSLDLVKDRISLDTHFKESEKLREINKEFGGYIPPSERKELPLEWRSVNKNYLIVCAVISPIFIGMLVGIILGVTNNYDGSSNNLMIFILVAIALLGPLIYFYIRIGMIMKNFYGYQMGNLALKEKLKGKSSLLDNIILKGFSTLDLGPKKEAIGLNFAGRYKITDDVTKETIFFKYIYIKKFSWMDKYDVTFYLGPIKDTNINMADDMKLRIKKLESL